MTCRNVLIDNLTQIEHQEMVLHSKTFHSTLSISEYDSFLYITTPLKWVFQDTPHEVYFGTLLEIKDEFKPIHVDGLVGHPFEVWTCCSRRWMPTIG